jgi:hypothetical protein
MIKLLLKVIRTNLNSIIINSDDAITDDELVQSDINRKYLIQVLPLINFFYYWNTGVLYQIRWIGWDSLDMLADAFVYGMSY